MFLNTWADSMEAAHCMGVSSHKYCAEFIDPVDLVVSAQENAVPPQPC